MIDIAVALKAASLAQSVAKYIGIVQDRLSLKLDQLAGSELEAGLRALQQASTSEKEQQFLLREARSRFNKAVSLEKDLRLAATHLGLALCHVNLGDVVNAERSLRDLIEVELPSQSILVPLAPAAKKTNTFTSAFFLPIIIFAPVTLPVLAAMAASAATEHYGEKQKTEYDAKFAPLLELQKQAADLLEQSLRDGYEKVFGLYTG